MSKNVENWLKWVEKNDLGVSGGQERSKFRCGSIGSAPGPQKLPEGAIFENPGPPEGTYPVERLAKGQICENRKAKGQICEIRKRKSQICEIRKAKGSKALESNPGCVDVSCGVDH